MIGCSWVDAMKNLLPVRTFSVPNGNWGPPSCSSVTLFEHGGANHKKVTKAEQTLAQVAMQTAAMLTTAS